MSTQTPPPSDQPDFLSSVPRTRPTRPRGAVLALAAVSAAAVIGAGGWVAVSLLADGVQPAEAVPASALGYVSLDLDPSASQKLEAVRIIEKFPALDEALGLDVSDDLRRWAFEQMQADGACKNLDYEADVAPWVGSRMALAAVPTEKQDAAPAPLVVLQVTDQEAAAEGVTALAECGEAGEDFGYAFTEDYLLVSDSTAHAEAFAAAAAEASLADDADFRTWTAAAGDPGFVTMYAAAGAFSRFLDLTEAVGGTPGLMPGSMPGSMPGPMTGPMTGPTDGGQAQGWFGYWPGDDQAMPGSSPGQQQMDDRLRSVYADVGAMAVVVRFADGAVEAEVAAETLPDGLAWTTSAGSTDVVDLPLGTAAAFSVAFPDGWLSDYLDLLSDVAGEGMPPMDQLLAEAEAQTGLELPEDLETLLGDSVSLAVDGDLDVGAVQRDPSAVPAGLRISGDPAEIVRVLEKVRQKLGPQGEMLVVEQGDGVVAVGLDPGYVRSLAGQGGLGDEVTFQDVVTEAETASSTVFVNFDHVTGWVEQGMTAFGGGAPDGEVLANLEPLAAFGISSWVEEDGSTRGVLRLTTD